MRLGLEGSGFVRELQVLDTPSSATPAVLPVAQARAALRLRVLEIAAATIGQFAQAREEVRTEHILPLADRLLAWLEQP